MLVLTRKQNEKIRIGDSITITVLRMKGKAVRLGIEAPKEVGVMRGELVFELESGAPTNDQGSVETEKKAPRSASASIPSVSTLRENHWPIEPNGAGSAPLRAMLKK